MLQIDSHSAVLRWTGQASFHRRLAVACSLVLWVGLAGVTHGLLTRYAFTPGLKAQAPRRWPVDAGIAHPPGRCTVVAFLHPRCPCSRATMAEFEHLVDDHGDSFSLTIVFLTDPEAGLTIDPRTDALWQRAAALRGASLYVDPDGIIARRFGAMTSGHVFAFDPDGTLEFEGGLTGSRGHAGECAGTVAIHAVLRGDTPPTRSAPVFGCDLFDDDGAGPPPP